jgi:uncharacterized protein YjbJ (UPF0337 family)
MKSSTKDQIRGTVQEMKGKAKKKAGQLVGNPRLENEGRDQELDGKVQRKLGQIEKVFDN